MLRFICFAALLLTTATAHAETPPPQECPCFGSTICRPFDQLCYRVPEICETSADCGPRLICDVSDGDDVVPGLCILPRQKCSVDESCLGGQLCVGNNRPPTCAEDDDLCADSLGLVCGSAWLCGAPEDPPCRDDQVCVQSRCTAPEFAEQIESVELDPAHIEAIRSPPVLPPADESGLCSNVPGRPVGSGLALIGLALAFGLRRSRTAHR